MPALYNPECQKRTQTLKQLDTLFEKNRRLIIRAVAQLTGVDKGSIIQILHDTFNMKNMGSLSRTMSQTIPLCL